MTSTIERIDSVAHSSPRSTSVPGSPNEGSVETSRRLCFKCGSPDHAQASCKSKKTAAGKLALEEYRKEKERWSKDRAQGKKSDKKQKRGGASGDLVSALKDALDKASGEGDAHALISKEKNELAIDVSKLEKENTEMKAWMGLQDGILDVALDDATKGLYFEWTQLRPWDFTMVGIAAFFGLALVVQVYVERVVSSTSDRLFRSRHYRQMMMALCLANTILCWVCYQVANVRLFVEVAKAEGLYRAGKNSYVMRHSARVKRVFALPEEERRDLRPDSGALVEVKHRNPRLAEIEYQDRLTSRTTRRVISVELFVQNTTGLNINYMDAEEIIRTRVCTNVPRNMTVALNRYDVLNSRHVVSDTADMVVAFYKSVKDRRGLELPNF